MFSDSRLVVGQVNDELEARDEKTQGHLYKWLNRTIDMPGSSDHMLWEN